MFLTEANKQAYLLQRSIIRGKVDMLARRAGN
jgi:hypothetical protein